MLKKFGCLLSPVLLVVTLVGLFFLLLLGFFSALFSDGGGPASEESTQIVQNALAMVSHLHPGGANGYDVQMDSDFPQQPLTWWEGVCGFANCGEIAKTNLQCGVFVGMAYSWAGLPLVSAGVALDWWADYAEGKQKGWAEIQAGAGLPVPGDIMMLQPPLSSGFASEGHTGIVVAVQTPTVSAPGSLTLAEANAPLNLVTMPLLASGEVEMPPSLPGYELLGYIRHLAPPGSGATATITVRHDQLNPAEYDATGFYTWANWAYSACSAGAMTNVIDGYGHNYRIVDILKVEYRLGEITPQLGLLDEAGIAKTAAQFGFNDLSTNTYSLEQVVSVAQVGHPVIVDFPPAKFAGGHLLVVTGGLVGDGFVQTVYVVDSGFDRSSITRSQFLAWWGGQIDILAPKG